VGSPSHSDRHFSLTTYTCHHEQAPKAGSSTTYPTDGTTLPESFTSNPPHSIALDLTNQTYRRFTYSASQIFFHIFVDSQYQSTRSNTTNYIWKTRPTFQTVGTSPIQATGSVTIPNKGATASLMPPSPSTSSRVIRLRAGMDRGYELSPMANLYHEFATERESGPPHLAP